MPMPRPCQRNRHLRWPETALVASSALLLAGCSAWKTADSLGGLVTPYRMEIVQGNVVTKEQLELLRPGVTRTQARDLLGSPLVTDVFHADRWDYVFTLRRQGAQPQRRVVVLHFDGDILQRVEAPDDLPTERDFVAAISSQRGTASPKTLELTDAQRAALPKPVATAASAPAAPLGVNRPYPPLEATP